MWEVSDGKFEAMTWACCGTLWNVGAAGTGDTSKLMRYWSSILGWSKDLTLSVDLSIFSMGHHGTLVPSGSMYTLLLSTSGGTNWIEPASALQELHLIYPILFAPPLGKIHFEVLRTIETMLVDGLLTWEHRAHLHVLYMICIRASTPDNIFDNM